MNNHSDPVVTLETITPDLAIALLGTNVHNRHVKPSLKLRLTNAMRRGDWRLNGETIKVSTDGALIDGQHRLLAVVDSGVTIQTLVVRGLSSDTQQTVDIGRTRTVADVLALEGYEKRSVVLAATLRYLKLMQTNEIRTTGAGQSSGSGRHPNDPKGAFSPQELMDVLVDFPYIYDSLDITDPLARAVGGSHSQYAALHAWFTQIDKDAADRFFYQLSYGIDLTPGNPIFALRRWLEVRRNGKGQWTRLNRLMVHALIVKAWNAWREGKQIRTLAWHNNTPLPEPK